MSVKIVTQNHLFGKVNGIHVDDMYDIYKRKEQLAYMIENKVDYVYSQDYDISYLAEIPTIKYLVLNEDVENIETLYLLFNLEGLVISSKYINDIDFTKLPKLNKIIIGHNNKESINVGINVKELRINSYDFADLTKINESSSLEKLHIFYGPKLRSLEGVERFPNLKEIVLNSCYRLHNISNLCSCSNLIKLSIHDCNKIEDLFDTISGIRNIEEINLYNTETWVKNTISDLSFLEDLPKLIFLKTDYKIINNIKHKKVINIK